MKLAPVYKSLSMHPDIDQIIVHTGQHYDQMMSSHFITELEIPQPNFNLQVGSQKPLIQFAQILVGLDEIFETEKPNLVIVYGDTNSTASGAIAAAKSNISLAHVESGLREYDKSIPEEINKLLTDAIADLYFAPTQTGYDELIRCGKNEGVYNVGDVGLDLINNNAQKIIKAERILEQYGIDPNHYVFMTCHRQANTDDVHKLKQIIEAANQFEERIFFPAHPRTSKAIKAFSLEGLLDKSKWIITGPIGFFETQALIKNAKCCLTDSGGVIKESYFHKTPAIICDKQTEWIETVKEGWCTVTGPDKKKILQVYKNLDSKNYIHNNSLGEGDASKKIAEIIVNYLQQKKHEV